MRERERERKEKAHAREKMVGRSRWGATWRTLLDLSLFKKKIFKNPFKNQNFCKEAPLEPSRIFEIRLWPKI